MGFQIKSKVLYLDSKQPTAIVEVHGFNKFRFH